MSEEEIIKYLGNVINTIKESDMLFDEPANIRCGLKMAGAIQGLLDLYEKEKEKNNSIEAQRLRDMCYKTDGDYISKDKIREKVIEIKNKKAENDFITTTQGKLDTIIALESLLEEE